MVGSTGDTVVSLREEATRSELTTWYEPRICYFLDALARCNANLEAQADATVPDRLLVS